MVDKDTTDAESLRQAKLVAARKKLKKFQSKRLDQQERDNESVNGKSVQEETQVVADNTLFTNQGSPLVKRSDSISIDMTPPTRPSIIDSTSQAQPLSLRAHSVTSPTSPASARTSPLASPPPPQSARASSITSPRIQTSSWQGITNDKNDEQQQSKTLLDLDEGKESSIQLQQELKRLKEKYEEMEMNKHEEIKSMHQQLHDSVEKQLLLEQEHNKLKQQLSEANTTTLSHQEKATDLQSSLEKAQNEILRLTNLLEMANDNDQKQQHGVENVDFLSSLDSNQQVEIENKLQVLQHERDEYKSKWEEASTVSEKHKAMVDELQASNTDFHAETTRLIDMVNDLEEELARTQADNYTKDCEIKSLSTKVMDLKNGSTDNIQPINNNNNDITSTDMNQQDETARHKLEGKIHSMEQQIHDYQQQLKSQTVDLEMLKEKCDTMEQQSAEWKSQLDGTNLEIERLQASLQEKDSSMTEKTNQLTHLQLDYDTLKEAANKGEQQTNELQQLLDSKEIDYSNLTASHEELEKQVVSLKDKLESIQMASSTKDMDISKFTESLQHLQQEKDGLEKLFGETKDILNDKDQDIGTLTSKLELLENDRNALKEQLEASQASTMMKDKELETASVDLGHLEQQYATIKQTLEEKESLYTDLLKTKDEIEQQLHETTAQNESISRQQRLVAIERMDHINQKIDHVMTTYERIERNAIDIEAKITAQEKQQLELHHSRQALALAESQMASYVDKLKEVEARATEQQEQIGKLETEKQDLENGQHTLQEKLETLQAELDEKQELAELFEDARTSLLEEQATLQSRLESSHANLEAQQTLVDTLNTQLQSRTAEIIQLEAKLKSGLQGSDNDAGGSEIWELKYQTLEQQLKDQVLAQQMLEQEKGRLESDVAKMKDRMDQLQRHANGLEQELSAERTATAIANDEIQRHLLTLESMKSSLANDDENDLSDKDDLLQQEREKRQEQVELLESQLTDLEQQVSNLEQKEQEQARLYDEKVKALAMADEKHEDMERMLEQARQQWMTEQTKVTTMTADISQLQQQLQHHLNDQQKLQRQLDETRQLLANRDQNTEALQWQVTDMESSVQQQLDQLTRQLKDAQEQAAAKTIQVGQLQEQLSSATSINKAHINDNDASTDHHQQEEEKKEEEDVISKHQLENENKELKLRLERQFEAFTTIRGELTTVRDRQLDVENMANKEKEGLLRERKGLEQTIERLRTEYQEHLERMWQQHEAMRHHHEEDLTVGRNALDAAQVKLMQNGLSPVSENGFEWVNSEDDDDDESHGDTSFDSLAKIPSLGVLPPLEKPAFFEFLETPRCSGCQSEVIDI